MHSEDLNTRFIRYGHVPFVVVIGLLSSDDQVRDHSDDDDADHGSDHATHDHRRTGLRKSLWTQRNMIMSYSNKPYICAYKFTYPLKNVQNVNNWNKIRGIKKIACFFLFSTVLNKLFHITDVYIYSTRQNNNWIY